MRLDLENAEHVEILVILAGYLADDYFSSAMTILEDETNIDMDKAELFLEELTEKAKRLGYSS